MVKKRQQQAIIEEEQRIAIEKFINSQKDQIYQLARRYFPLGFDPDEVLSEATIACYTALHEKRVQFMTPAGNSIFVWYIQKAFAQIHERRFADTIDRPCFYSPDEKAQQEAEDLRFEIDTAVSPEEMEGEGDSLPLGSFGSPHVSEHISPHYHVDVNSFAANPQTPIRLVQALDLLASNASSAATLAKVYAMYSCGTPPALLNGIRKDLANLQKNRTRVYKGRCLNGSYSAVVLCAPSKTAARKAMAKYGDVLHCEHFKVK